MGLPSSGGSYDHDPSERLLAGYLNHMDIDKSKVKKRWIVFQGNLETGLYQIKLYRKNAERVLKRSYTISRENFVGTEKGTLEKSKKSKTQILYWAIILVGETIFFQQQSTSTWIRSEIEEWNNTFKSHFDSVSNLVFPKKGFALSDDQLSLHLSSQSLSLVSLNPPKCYVKWELSRVHGCRINENVLGFHINSSGSDAGYFEIKCDSHSTCRRIRSAIEGPVCQINKQGSTCSPGGGIVRFPLNKERTVSLSASSPTLSKARYTPCPTSPLGHRRAPSVEWAPTPPTRYDLYNSSDLPTNPDSSLHFKDSIYLDVASISSSSGASSSFLS
ncbi:uncharacterized protein LOC117122813 [Anneissia japonica]|uniref:uncharacterized protein LOC117122813 n=1 Tax=Anneissia japonica TaxID=1529436 RepID=UPI0014256672|nr:uncharacterized protein LOC117122813 [Anneissia japonica]XP_033124464.1 uncharacterized protein LOC117122813 [Anneissia japonica]